jgi:spore germination protein YaaH
MSTHALRRGLAGLGAAALAVGLVQAVSPVASEAAPTSQRFVTGWMPYWSTSASTASVVANADLFSEVSPFWYSATWTGTAPSITTQVSSTAKASALSSLRTAGVPIVPAITDGMPARRLAAVMADATQRGRLVNQLVTLTVNEGFAGIDLDFEGFAFSDGSSTWPTTRPAWVTFIAQLSAALHAKGKILSVTTPPIYDTDRDGSSGYWVYDWAGIAPHVDRLRIMTYDYSVSGGPIAPYSWVESVVRFAVTQVPSGKIQIGVAAYGRNAVVKWRPTPTSSLVPKVVGTCPTNRPSNYLSVLSFTAASKNTAIPSAPYSSATVSRTAAVRTWNKAFNGKPTYETYFTYQVTYKGVTSSGASTSCTVYRNGWYDDASAAAQRATLVGTYKLRGIAQWTIGGEDAAQWAKLRSYGNALAPKPTTVSMTSRTMATYGSRLTIAATALSAGVPVTDTAATLFFRRTPTASWARVMTGTTDATGRVAFVTKALSPGYYRVHVSSASGRLSGAVNGPYLRVRSAIALTQSATVIDPGDVVRVTAAVTPVQPGQRVLRQIRSGTKWVTVATVRTGTGGRATFAFDPTSAGRTYRYRVLVPATGYAGATKTFSVTVR